MIFQAVRDARPYPAEAVRDGTAWSDVPPTMVRLDELTTTRSQLDLGRLLADDSTFYGDIFAHVVRWKGRLFLEDGLHRALRAALAGRPALHARVLDLDAKMAAAAAKPVFSTSDSSNLAGVQSGAPAKPVTGMAARYITHQTMSTIGASATPPGVGNTAVGS